jgi:hypothetical protein
MGTLLAEGAANSREVFSAIFLKLGDAGMTGLFVDKVFCGGTTCELTPKKKLIGCLGSFSASRKQSYTTLFSQQSKNNQG